MNRMIELHDSTVEGLERVGPAIVVRLRPAYVHQSEGRPGFDSGTGWGQAVDLILREATVESLPTRFPMILADGAFSIDGSRWENQIPIPLEVHHVPVVFSVVTEASEALILRGEGASVVLRGDPRFVELVP
ncbi:hypothetical protein [Tautonia marina]|uniref:hypothetical protein n=1 Tax=Tautonia marina TaxID=2653855 RepID=UPI00126048C5|nr:hypothetical protein [Tautonia marina]